MPSKSPRNSPTKGASNTYAPALMGRNGGKLRYRTQSKTTLHGKASGKCHTFALNTATGLDESKRERLVAIEGFAGDAGGTHLRLEDGEGLRRHARIRLEQLRAVPDQLLVLVRQLPFAAALALR